MFYFNFIAIYLLLGRCSPQVHCLVATLFLSLILVTTQVSFPEN